LQELFVLAPQDQCLFQNWHGDNTIIARTNQIRAFKKIIFDWLKHWRI
jgi:hypothetical protein